VNDQLLLITPLFPSPRRPDSGAFVYEKAKAMASARGNIDVAVFTSWLRSVRKALRLRKVSSMSPHPGLHIEHIRYANPWRYFVGPPAARQLASHRAYRSAVDRYLRRREKPDFVLAYFMGAGVAVEPWCTQNSVDYYVEVGDSPIETVDRVLGPGNVRRMLAHARGVVAVSASNAAYCISACPSLTERLIVLPNACDQTLFRPIPQDECRKRLGLPLGDPIVVYCGHYEERKGPLRVLTAIRQLDGVKGIFIGHGPQRPTGPEVLKTGVVAHEDVPVWLCAGDVFVLPSLAEGMANAIVEAMCCGLPLVVADRPFNREYLSEDCAVFVDPLDPAAIAKAIRECIVNREANASMRRAALALSRRFQIGERTERFFEFVDRTRTSRMTAE
jgi:glycosyltransferase involved in cell wall biosynthesis